ncbi:PREDICTED: calcium-transporting ATPase 8, plasma membrane-type-like [Tarenaya hassleriana]|uniref:calcium-transporting ATPase 8, plasma membrane-type-like n=1 Tax=Tarenaya hassleriana TaxID=28532 RepID=UPI0008FCFE65|nr:PREDICTED: calcium-transporting ATPase 8, plasma membrane-type-like [Tarenaya hassleriana]
MFSHRRIPQDLEAGTSAAGGDCNLASSDTTRTKNASVKHLRHWRVANLQQGIEEPVDAVPSVTSSAADFGIRLEELVPIARDFNIGALKQYHGVEGLSILLKTDLQKGISGDGGDILRRKKAFGSNAFPCVRERSFWTFLWEASQDITLVLLMVAAIASLLLGIKTKTIKYGWYDEAGLAFAVIFVIIVTAISDYQQFLQFENLNQEKQKICLEVTSGGRRIKVSIYDIVVGDIIPLRIGDQVPADGVLVSGHSLQVDESEITGQPRTVQKDPNMNPFLLSGSKVEDGIGTMLVTGVGMNTEWGLLMANIPLVIDKETPLQIHLNGIANGISFISLSLAFVVFLIQSWLYFSGHTKNTDGTTMFVSGKTTADKAIDNVIRTIILGVTIVVVAVPDGLPLAVTLNLAYTTRKIVPEKALVCYFQTATSSILLEQIFAKGDSIPVVSGSATERAILDWGVKLGMRFDDVRSRSSVLHVSPFNPNKKRRGVALKLNDFQVRVHWKGAAETILTSCTRYMGMDNDVIAISKEKELYFETIIKEMCTRGLRCAALAYQTYAAGDFLNNECDLILLAIIGIKDSCQPGVRDAVQLCRSANIKIRMVTGDDVLTAKAMALECGILISDDNISERNIIKGNEFRALSIPDQEQMAESILVMGQSTPEDNLLLLKALRTKGHVVAVTGKEIHDAPSLLQADIGLAMGIGGTAVAKESSDIIILDDSFASIVKVIQWGRSLDTNIQKFGQFRLTVSASALIICVVVALHSGDFPLNVVQILWVNLLIDTLGALALASEPPTEQLMKMPPVSKRQVAGRFPFQAFPYLRS